MEPSNVILGASIFLHTGHHGSILDTPPLNIQYIQSGAVHNFLLPSERDTPFSAPALAECVDFGEGTDPVHSRRWPVLNRSGWVADLDCFGYAFFCSQYALSPAFRDRECRIQTRSAEFSRQMSIRVRNLATAYAHRSCAALLIHTRAEIERMDEWLARLKLGEVAEQMRAKVRLFYPAATAAAPEAVRRKWQSANPLRVVFCGRGFEAKRGRWAIEAFHDAVTRFPNVECVYIGDVPDDERGRLADPRCRYFPYLDHDGVLAVFAQSHIVFHPGENESVGAVLIEAAAAGMAVITAHGVGMEHTREWFAEADTIVERSQFSTLAAEEEGFRRCLFNVLTNVEGARQDGFRNYRVATEGVLSIAQRDRLLLEVYDECRRSSSPPLTLETFTRPAGSHDYRVSSHNLTKAIRAYRNSIGFMTTQMDFTFEPD